MAVARFDIHLVRLDPTVGSEIRKVRPCVIVSPDEMNAPSGRLSSLRSHRPNVRIHRACDGRLIGVKARWRWIKFIRLIVHASFAGWVGRR
jgi:hypothetical protein